MSVFLYSGPFIVYLLKEADIIEDWTAIKKVSTLSECKL